MTDILRQATIAETGASAYAVGINIGNHQLTGDEPVANGGGDLGPSPFDYLTAALGSCTVMTIRWYAARQNWPLEQAEAVVTHEKRDGRDHFIKRLTLIGENLTNDQRAKLLDVAGKCPVQKTLAAGATIETAFM